MKALRVFLQFILTITLFTALCATIGFSGAFLYLTPRLPSLDSLKDVHYQVPLRIYTHDEKLIAEYGEKRRIPVQYRDIPERLVQAFISAEDDRFFHHPGVDYKGILRAVVTLIRTGQRRQGGSTITMQVARNFFLSRKKTYSRKLNEIFLSLKIERELTKQDILQLYLNKIYLGHRSYGIAAAAKVYYGKTLDQLTLPQQAMIAGLPKAPSAYNPVTNPTRALQRRNYVLERMKTLQYVSEQAYTEAISEPVTARYHGQFIETSAPYISEMVRAEMVERYGDNAMIGGYQVYTTIISDLQTTVVQSLRQALSEYDERHGYRGPEAHVDLDIETEIDYNVLDQKLNNIPRVGGLKPGFVTQVNEKDVSVYLGDDTTITLPWKGLSWAKKLIDYNRRGPTPKSASDILNMGDLIRIRQTIPSPKDKKTDENPEAPIWRLSQIPKVSGAIVSLSPDNGAIQALQGGFDFYYSKFNRVTQAKRQPGSGFKPFVYTSAIDKGYTAATLINDAPIVLNDTGSENIWRPENYEGKTYGPTRLRKGLIKSRNLISIRLLRDIGVEYARNFVTRFGFPDARLPHNLSLVLGTGTFTPLEMATAYTAMANGGYKVNAFFIERIDDGQNNNIFTHEPVSVCQTCFADDHEPLSQIDKIPPFSKEETDLAPDEAIDKALEDNTVDPEDESEDGSEMDLIAQRILSPQVHYIIHSILLDVVKRGTGVRAKRALKRTDIAGKTGTTNDQKDAWFYGYNQDYVTVAWVGFDDVSPLGNRETGGRAALPMWIKYMKVALKEKPEREFPQPDGIVTVKIDKDSGLRSSTQNPNAMFEIFREDYVPKQAEKTDNIKNGKDPFAPDEELF